MQASSNTVYGRDYFEGDASHLQSGYTYERVYPYAEAIVGCLVDAFAPDHALDVGCARGFFVQALRQFEVEASGIDGSAYAISKARREDREFLLHIDIDAEAFPFADETFDLVTALHVLEHLHDASLSLSEMNRVVKQDGHILVAVPTGEILKGRHDTTHDALLSTDGWISLFGQCGLEPDREAQNRFRLAIVQHARSFREACKNLYRHTIPSSLAGRLLRSTGRGGDDLRVEVGGWLLHSNWLKALEKTRGIFLLKRKLRPGAVEQ